MSADAQAAWIVGKAKDPVSGQDRCMLSSDPITIGDGYGQTKVTLFVNDSALAVVTDSEIDTSFKDLGLQADNNDPVATEKVLRKKVVVFDQGMETIIKQFKAGREASVFLRFWPTWPPTERFAVKFSLKGFTKAYEGLAVCSPPEGGSQPAQ